MAKFLIGEGRLENYLDENPPIDVNHDRAKTGLVDAKTQLQSVIGPDGRKAGISLDAHLLLAKLCYACGQFDDCLDHIVKAELNSLTEKPLSIRSLRILAESYAIKGLCLEAKTPKSSSKYQIAEHDSEMFSCFEKASDLGILYLQGQDSNSNTYGTLSSTGSAGSEPRRMGTVLETVLQRAPIVLIRAGKLQEAIDRYRHMLRAMEVRATQSLRLTLARQLAEVLLRGVSGQLYTPPTALSPAKSTAAAARRIWEPKKYTSRQQFIPRNLPEETILLLLIAESLAVKDAVLSQSPEFSKERMHANGNASAVYDLLSLALVRWGEVNLLYESLEKALKFSFQEAHIWTQYSLSLVALGRHAHAFRAFEETSKLIPNDCLSHLLAARQCYEHLDTILAGIDCANAALKRDTKRPSRAQLYVGIGLTQMATSSHLKSERERYKKLALDALERAVQADSNDHLAEFYLAYYHAHNYNVPDALLHIRQALSLRAEHPESLHLFALLLSANQRPREALTVVKDALDEFPDDLNLLHLRAHLELNLDDVDTALETMQKMFAVWRELYESQTSNSSEHDGTERHSETKSAVFQMHNSQMSDKDSSK